MEPIQQYPMTIVLYGIASSAFYFKRSVIKVGNRCSEDSLAQTIKNHSYVDDYLSGANSITAAHAKVQKVCEELKKYEFQHRKWSSSHHEISSLPDKFRENPDKVHE